MNNTESVGDECAVVTDQLDESLGELDPLGFVLAGLARVETDVLEHQDVTVGESFGTSQRVLSHDVTGELHVATEDFGQLRGNRCEGELGIGLTVGAPEVRGHDDLRSTLGKCPQGGSGRDDATRVRDFSAIQRDVEVGTHQYGAPFDPSVQQILQRLNCHCYRNSAQRDLATRPMRSARRLE